MIFGTRLGRNGLAQPASSGLAPSTPSTPSPATPPFDIRSLITAKTPSPRGQVLAFPKVLLPTPVLKLGPWTFPIDGGFEIIPLKRFVSDPAIAEFFTQIFNPPTVEMARQWFDGFKARAQPGSKIGVGSADPLVEVLNDRLAGRWGLGVSMPSGSWAKDHPHTVDCRDMKTLGHCISADKNGVPNVTVYIRRWPEAKEDIWNRIKKAIARVIDFVGDLIESLKPLVCGPAKPYMDDLAEMIAVGPYVYGATKMAKLSTDTGIAPSELEKVGKNPKSEMVKALTNAIVEHWCGEEAVPTETPPPTPTVPGEETTPTVYPPNSVAVFDTSIRQYRIIAPTF